MVLTIAVLAGVLMPPPEFDRPYDGDLVIQYEEPAAITPLCQGARIPKGKIVQACAYRSNHGCRIVFPKDTGVYPKVYLERLMRHEIAHCNGWVHD